MNIVPLKKYPHYKDQVVEWLYSEFGCPESYRFYKELIEHSMVENQIPITFIAVENDVLLGTISLWRGDLLSRQDLFPWAAGLVVNPKYRGQKIGAKLQQFIVDYCKSKNFKEIYLYTELENYYEKSNWEALGKGYEYMGGEVTIYKKTL